MPPIADNVSLAAHGLVDGFKALPVAIGHGIRVLCLAVWRVLPRKDEGYYHVSYIIGMVLFVLLVVYVLSLLRRRSRRPLLRPVV